MKEEEKIKCDMCGEYHPIMEDNKDGTFTCLPCLTSELDGFDLDNSMGVS